MALSLSLSRAVPVAAIALGWTALSFGAITATPAEARGNAPHYSVELAAPAKEARTIAGGIAWSCEGTTCVAGKGSSRPEVMCARLQREVGQIASFTTDGKALPAEKLASCNTK